MTDFDYPPTRTYRLEAAVEDASRRHDDAEARVAELEGDEDASTQALADAHQDRQQAANHLEALEWAVSEFGGDDELTLQAFTATGRSRTLDALNRTRVGAVGPQETEDWLIASGITMAPWLDGSEGLQERAEITGQLPPGLRDWLNMQLDDLGDLSEGN